MTRTSTRDLTAPAVEGTDRVWRIRVLALAAGAIVLRFLLLLGRGDYLAFDEGWYLLLARSLYTGDGYSLVGIPHVTLSPLYPLLAGAVAVAVDSWVWGGRIVAATASGLLVIPVWYVFRTVTSARTAFSTALLVAVLPSMAPFVVPFWIGADLWVGAEPLLHLLLFTAIALWLRADRNGHLPAWAAAGAVFGLAFLARPEAVIAWGILGIVALAGAAIRRSPGRLVGAVLMGLGFGVVAAPYWIHIHDVTGTWSLTGRAVAPLASAVGGEASGRGGPASDIERMLWSDDTSYEQRLYGLDPSGLRLRSEYWGVYPGPSPESPGSEPSGAREPDATDPEQALGPLASAEDTAAGAEDSVALKGPSTLVLYFRSLGQIAPLLLWPLVLVGVFWKRPARQQWRAEGAVAGALFGTSLAVAGFVAVDPRTQLFLAPLLCFYAAQGLAVLDELVQERSAGDAIQPRFLQTVLLAAGVAWLLGINGQRLYRSLTYGSPHHVVAEQNRRVGEELSDLVPLSDGPVASWHPAIALYADRDWRVLPFATFPEIVRYARAADARVMVLSAYYPPPLGVENLNTRYLVLPVPERDDERAWTLRIEHGDSIRSVGVLDPVPPDRP